MRLSPVLLCLGLAASSLSVAGVGQRPDDQIAPQSTVLLNQGQTLLGQGKFLEANDALETALAVDPKNRAVFVVMAQVAMKQQLFGKAIRLTNKALLLEPNDRSALAVQGEAMVEAGATARANDNLAKIKKLCGTSACPEAGALSAVINRGPTLAAAKKPAAEPKKN